MRIIDSYNNKFLQLIVFVLTVIVSDLCFAVKYPNKYILIYNDQGVNRELLQDTIHVFKNKQLAEIKQINADELNNSTWIKDALLLVIPAGLEVEYSNKISIIAIKNIQEFIQQGGGYLGIGGGANFASTNIQFENKATNEVATCKTLELFAGTSVGPMYETKDVLNKEFARVVTLHWKDEKSLSVDLKINTYYLGGGYFENALAYPRTKVLASYDCCMSHPAILHIKYGKGNVILSAVDIEYQPKVKMQDKKYLAHMKQINQQLTAQYNLLEQINEQLLRYLNL